VGGKGEKAGGLGQMAISFLWLAPRTEAGGLGRRPAGLPATTADGERGKRRRATRGFFSSLTLGRGSARRWLHGRRRTGGGGARGRRRSSAQSRGEGSRGDAWRPGERPALFIGGGRRFGRGFFELGKLRWFNNGSGGGNIPPLTPSGEAAAGIRGGAATLCDGICRAGVRGGGRATRWRVRRTRL
jgi:hypothetical protein